MRFLPPPPSHSAPPSEGPQLLRWPDLGLVALISPETPGPFSPYTWSHYLRPQHLRNFESKGRAQTRSSHFSRVICPLWGHFPSSHIPSDFPVDCMRCKGLEVRWWFHLDVALPLPTAPCPQPHQEQEQEQT